MPLSPGQQVGSYEVVSLLGAGGMGEVYRARDTRLKRDVAIKVLPDDVAGDHERLARFQREAEVLASLNHPHIAHIYGIEGNALIMELVEGEDLAQRIARGAVPIDEALPIARQIAEALEAAHDAGIIHRDLKPANVKVRPDGTVKVLDFGLAKAIEQGSGTKDQGSGGAANSPTITSPAMTMRGMILGTAAYMSPEQAKGKAVDRRADIWAFGCVLYEMLTGRRTFEGEDISDTLVSILRDDPRWAALPANTPPHIRQLLRRCLQRDPQKRLPHIGAARLELGDPDTGELINAATPPRPRSRWAWLGAAVFGGAITAAAIMLLMRRSPAAADASVAFVVEAPAGAAFTGANRVPRFAVSPDGRSILYQAEDGKGSALWIRPIDSIEATKIAGTESDRGGADTQQAFWSPDGRHIAFFDETTHELKRVDRQTGSMQVIAPIPGNQYGGAWAGEVIVMASFGSDGVQQVVATGGTPVQVTKVDRSKHEVSHLWPDFFPDGKHIVYLVTYSDTTPSALFLASLDGTPPRRLFEAGAMARAAAPDFLIYIRSGALMAQRIDLTSMQQAGDPILISVTAQQTPVGRAAVSVSPTGVLAYAPMAGDGDIYETRWVDRSGRDLPAAPAPVSVGIHGVRLSPDGQRLVYSRGLIRTAGNLGSEIWLQDIVRGIETRLGERQTGDPSTPIFSPDGAFLIYRARINGPVALLERPVSGAGPEQTLFAGVTGELWIPFDATPDGTSIIANRGGSTDGGLWLVPRRGKGPATPFLPDTRVPFGADLSPDGRWLAYASGSAIGGVQIIVQAFPDPAGGRWPVSAVGGEHPRWRGDGREIFYIDQGRRVMAASITTSPRVEIGTPVELFKLEAGRGYTSIGPPYQFDVTSDGQRFVLVQSKSNVAGTGRLLVTTNWQKAFKVNR